MLLETLREVNSAIISSYKPLHVDHIESLLSRRSYTFREVIIVFDYEYLSEFMEVENNSLEDRSFLLTDVDIFFHHIRHQDLILHVLGRWLNGTEQMVELTDLLTQEAYKKNLFSFLIRNGSSWTDSITTGMRWKELTWDGVKFDRSTFHDLRVEIINNLDDGEFIHRSFENISQRFLSKIILNNKAREVNFFNFNKKNAYQKELWKETLLIFPRYIEKESLSEDGTQEDMESLVRSESILDRTFHIDRANVYENKDGNDYYILGTNLGKHMSRMNIYLLLDYYNLNSDKVEIYPYNYTSERTGRFINLADDLSLTPLRSKSPYPFDESGNKFDLNSEFNEFWIDSITK